MKKISDKVLKDIFNQFYQIILSNDHLRIFFKDEEQVKQVIEKQIDNIKSALKEDEEALKNRFVKVGKLHFDIGVPFYSFIFAFNILHNLFKSSVEVKELDKFFSIIKNYAAKGYLLSYIDKHANILIPFYIDLKKEKVKENDYEGYLEMHIFFMLNLTSAIKEKNYDFPVIDAEECPFDSWLNTKEARELLKEDYSLVNISHKKIHKLARTLLKSLSSKDYILGVNLYNEIMDSSLTILSYIRAHRESILLEKKGKLQNIVRKLRKLSEHDVITGLHNEVRLSKILNIQLRTKKKFFIAAFDVDDFRYVNQVYGFKIGNLLLKQMADVIKQESQNRKIFNFKIGSNTFISIIFEKDAQDFIKRLKKKIENIEVETKIEGHSVKFFPKITTAYMRIDEINSFTSPDEVIETLEIVLHRGKIENRGGIVEYNPEIDSKLEVAKLLDKQIFLGFAIKEEKIVPYFQPIFDLNTGKIFAYEVLFRIEDNGRALPAGDYIDVAYKTGLIVEIDKAVLNYLKGNLDKLEGFNLFINISAPFVKDKDFLELTPDICNCVYEITEQIAVDNIDKLKNLVKNSNVKMALDDFGSGYSSIKTVVELTTGGVINYLKIDGSLIKDLNKSKENFYIVESVVKMAKTLGLKTVAEFIENEEILKTVKQLGIDYAQGFYLGKPKPLSEIVMLEHFYNREYFLKQLKRELARVKRYKRNLSILRIDIKNNVPDDDIFIFAESISNNLRITDLFVKWDKHTLLIAAPEISKENAKGIKRKVLNLSKELSKKNEITPVDISTEIFEITPETKVENEKEVIDGVLGEFKFEEKV